MQPVKAADLPLMTEDEYLRFENAAAERHVYLDGRVWAMAGESINHSYVTTTIVSLLFPQLDDSGCFAHTKETRVRSGPPGPRPFRSTSGMYSYPDIVVVCGEPEYGGTPPLTITNPKVIIEVLSPTTEQFDLGVKFERYRRWNSTLAEYVVVSQDAPRVVVYARTDADEWTDAEYLGLDAVVSLPSVNCSLPLARVYKRVSFTAGN